MHNQSFPSASENALLFFWWVFGEHVGDTITNKLLDATSKKILYRSVVHPAEGQHPNKHLDTDVGEQTGSMPSRPFVFV